MPRGRRPGRNPECWTIVSCSTCSKIIEKKISDLTRSKDYYCSTTCRGTATRKYPFCYLTKPTKKINTKIL